MSEQGGARERPRHGGSEAPEISAMAGADEDGDTFQDASTGAPAANQASEFDSNQPAEPMPMPENRDELATVELGPGTASRHARESSASQQSAPDSDPSAPAMDDVSLDETSGSVDPARSRSSTVVSKSTTDQTVHQARPPSKLSIKSSSTLWDSLSPQPSGDNRSSVATTPVRKLTSPFSWLSRMSAKDTPAVTTSATGAEQASSKDPPQRASSRHPRRGQSDLVLDRTGGGQKVDGYFDHTPALSPGNNLRVRFKLQRLRGQAGIESLGEPGADFSESGQPSGDSADPRSTDDRDVGEQREPERRGHFPSPSAPILPSPVDPKLAPGTVAGMAAGPSTAETSSSIDWDLWQALVYEGPASVVQKSSEELSQAIAGGIPSAIRGVVWQVLANSKDAELERVFHELAGGPDASGPRRPPAEAEPTSSTPLESPPGDSGVEHAKADESKADGTPAPDASGSRTPTPAGVDGEPSSSELLPKLLLRHHQKTTAIDPTALQKLEKIIKRDMGGRTSFSKYTVSAGLQENLFRVCKAYALFDPVVGYAQGMNFLAMPMLFNMPEEEAFSLLVRLMHHYKLRDMFVPDMPGLHLHLYQFERLLEDLEPALFCHLHRRGVEPTLYATQWFLTLFAYRFPLQLVLRVYDLVLSEGLEGAILRFGLVLMQKNAAKLLEMNEMSSLTHYLQERLFDAYIDQAPSANSILESGFFGSSGGSDKVVYRADALVQDACGVSLTVEALRRYTDEWEEKVRLDRSRETELETLRSTNATLSGQVRSLEERIEKFDSEHVQVASELVRTKVENEELKEEVETLKGQLEELQSELVRQPHEVEAKLKEEMERIMQRNIEVQNENRALEEQMTEMEKDLVDAKMRHAQLHSEHEALKQRWHDLKKAIEG